MTPLVPADFREAAAPGGQDAECDTERDEEQREHDGHVGGTGPVQRAERKLSTLPERDETNEDERSTGDAVGGHHRYCALSTLPIFFTTSASRAASFAHHALNSSASM